MKKKVSDCFFWGAAANVRHFHQNKIHGARCPHKKELLKTSDMDFF
jgi:hypothetical protein